MGYININGKVLPAKKATISAQDRGFRFGDGMFETCLIYNRKIYNWQAHQARLEDGLKAIKINFDSTNLEQSCRFLIQKNQIKNGYLRIAISRGVGSRGYLPIKNISPTLVIETIPPISKPKTPIHLWISKIQKPSLKSLPVNYKLMQGLNSSLVKLEAAENNCFDAIILNAKNQICETSSANIFWIKDDVLYTPHLDCGCLQGTIREKIITLSPFKIKFTKAKLNVLMDADEVFITNVGIGIMAVEKIAEKKFENRKFSKIFTKLLKNDIKKYNEATSNL